MKSIKVVMLIITLTIFIFLIFPTYKSTSKSEKQIKTTDYLKNKKIIAHAFGEIDGRYYTNSLEAFKKSYENGIRDFEVDLLLTSDNKIVLSHKWSNRNSKVAPTLEEFLNRPIYNEYTSLQLIDLLKLMEQYPDINIITDTKYTEKEEIEKQFAIIINEIKKNNYEYLLNRLIIQIYNEEMYETITNLYSFPKIMFTLYNRYNGEISEFKKICEWSVSKNIKSIIVEESKFNQQIYIIATQNNLELYVHTINNHKKAKLLFKLGVKGIYSDKLNYNSILKD